MKKEEFLNKYGHLKVKLDMYYKYCFTFSGECEVDGKKVFVSVETGGDADSIYKDSFSTGYPETIESLDIYSGHIKEVDGEVIGEFYDY